MYFDENEKKIFKIFLVEDNIGDVKLIEEVLSQNKLVKVDISVAKDGEDAIQYFKNSRFQELYSMPDLIILDLNLPKKNGFEVLMEIKNNPLIKHIPVIFLTTSSSPNDVRKAYELHANCYIKKPVDFEQFEETINDLLKFWFVDVLLCKN